MTIKHKLFLFIKLPLRLRIKHFIINAHYLFKKVICHFLKTQFFGKSKIFAEPFGNPGALARA